MKTKMEEAGYILERIDKTFEYNRMYIFLFRPRPVDRPPVLQGPNLGQTLPVMTPELFGPEILSTGGHPRGVASS